MNKYRDRKLSPTGTSLEPLEKKIYQKLKSLRPKLEGEKLIVAVSGGIDSIVLLNVFCSLSTRLGYSLHVIHVNHGVRGFDSDADAAFVKAQCKKLKILNSIKKLANIKSDAGEGLLRDKRYEVLFAAQKKLKASFIVIAHHRDDLLETRLIRLLQGTGIHGLKAMVIQSKEGLLRPFLDINRSEIEQYARKKDLSWRNDATNEDTAKLRNWVRRKWLRPLRNEHPGYIDNLFESLQRIVQNNNPVTLDSVFDRKIALTFDEPKIDEKLYNFLRHHAQTRITSRHVNEFKKRLRSPQRHFVFRLAGVNWMVSLDSVAPR
ncbi:MAG: tRNA lysidine(34) synthetase TilS [Oligoflexia bacterium]|nr:tRNA lysidine(34) synthetase TilS [Oligoflexia bacterium]